MTKTFANIGVWLCALAVAACSGDPGQPVSYGAAQTHDASSDSGNIGDIAAAACTAAQQAKCNDGKPCTADKCDPATGACANLTSSEHDGEPCDDGNACSKEDTCHSGLCHGLLTDCNDGNPCTIDEGCIDGFCSYAPLTISDPSCDDGNPCTQQDACGNGKCAGQPFCDDAKPCTLDSCGGGVCKHVDQCDDGLDCTVDACTPAGCTHGDTCMGAFACSADNGTCQPVAGCNGAISAAYLALVDQYKDSVGSFQNLQTKCTFKNDCLAKTGDSEQQACIAKCLTQETPLDATCAACYGVYDGCIAKNCAALCNGAWLSADCAACQATHCDAALKACADPAPTKCQMPTSWGPNLQVISKLALADVSVGCDLDGDGKPNNEMGKLKTPEVDNLIQDAISSGAKLRVLYAPEYGTTDGASFAIESLDAVLDASNLTCNVAASGAPCKVRVKAANYNATAAAAVCTAKHVLDPASASGGALKVAPGSVAQWVPAFALSIEMPVQLAAWTGSAADAAQWQSTKKGLQCGAVNKAALVAAVKAAPPSEKAKLGDAVTPESVASGLLKPDLDLDGDGVKESVSFALTFETVPVVVTGISP